MSEFHLLGSDDRTVCGKEAWAVVGGNIERRESVTCLDCLRAPAESVFLILSERYTGEDHSGRDTYEVLYDPDCDPGFFTSREAAQAWIDERSETAEKRYQQAVQEHEAKVAAWEANKVEIERSNRRMAEYALQQGLRAPARTHPPAKPYPPNRRNFGEVYSIHEIQKEA